MFGDNFEAAWAANRLRTEQEFEARAAKQAERTSALEAAWKLERAAEIVAERAAK